jgi:hypothetical protein
MAPITKDEQTGEEKRREEKRREEKRREEKRRERERRVMISMMVIRGTTVWTEQNGQTTVFT